MSLSIEWEHIEEPAVYQRNGREVYFDPIREIFILKNPEEIIRQKMVQYLQSELGAPKSMIEVEVPLSDFKEKARGRVDILVSGSTDNNELAALMLIECKAPGVPLTDDVFEQAAKYDEIIVADCIIITNGIELRAYGWDESIKWYKLLSEIPSYNSLVTKQKLKFVSDEFPAWKRPAFESYSDPATIQYFTDQLVMIGEDTPKELHPILINIGGFLLDETKRMKPQKLYGIDIIEDGGIRNTCFGNAAGGQWAGEYRYFILKDEAGNNQIVSMRTFASGKFENHEVWGNRKGTTTFVVAIDDLDKKHNSLQLNLDAHLRRVNNGYVIWHDGRLTAGKSGSTKRTDVLDFIRINAPELIGSDGMVFLGKLTCTEELSWDQPETNDFIGRMIKYALVRDQFRKQKLAAKNG